MKSFFHLTMLGALGLWVGVNPAAWGQVLNLPPLPIRQTTQVQAGVEPLTHGPLHEAYAAPSDNQPQPPLVVPRQPPPPIEELPANQRPDGDNVQWIPGYWGWDEDRQDFVWVSGFWRVPPPGRVWVAGRWTAAQGGFQWVPGFWQAAEQPTLQYLPPPPAPLEAAPSVPAPDADCIYSPGYWTWQTTRYVWHPGCWLPCRPGWVWVPPRYVWTPCGFVFVNGYWDLDFCRRGLLFAPVYLARDFCFRPGWVFQPRFVVHIDFLPTALFVRARYCHFFFGDYFAPHYRDCGFVPWIDYRINRYIPDPLFACLRWQHRHDLAWERNLRGLYAARFNGTVPRPPRTLVQQNTLIQNMGNNNVNVTNVNYVTVVGPLHQVARTANNLRPLSREQRDEFLAQAGRLRELSRQRDHLESQIPSRPAVPGRPLGGVYTARLDLSRLAVAKAAQPAVVPTQPAKPVLPARPEPTTLPSRPKIEVPSSPLPAPRQPVPSANSPRQAPPPAEPRFQPPRNPDPAPVPRPPIVRPQPTPVPLPPALAPRTPPGSVRPEQKPESMPPIQSPQLAPRTPVSPRSPVLTPTPLNQQPSQPLPRPQVRPTSPPPLPPQVRPPSPPPQARPAAPPPRPAVRPPTPQSRPAEPVRPVLPEPLKRR